MVSVSARTIAANFPSWSLGDPVGAGSEVPMSQLSLVRH